MCALDLQSCLPRFSNVYFIDASSSTTIVADLEHIALVEGLVKSWESTLDWLALRREEWLLLLNNADDTTVNLRDYFPRCSHGNILITSRNRETVQHASEVESRCQVSGMDPTDAMNMLFYISGFREGHSKDAEAVAMEIVKVYFTVV